MQSASPCESPCKHLGLCMLKHDCLKCATQCSDISATDILATDVSAQTFRPRIFRPQKVAKVDVSDITINFGFGMYSCI